MITVRDVIFEQDKNALLNLLNELISYEDECMYNSMPMTEEMLRAYTNKFLDVVAEENGEILGFCCYKKAPNPNFAMLVCKRNYEDRVKVIDLLVKRVVEDFISDGIETFTNTFPPNSTLMKQCILLRYTTDENMNDKGKYEIDFNIQEMKSFLDIIYPE